MLNLLIQCREGRRLFTPISRSCLEFILNTAAFCVLLARQTDGAAVQSRSIPVGLPPKQIVIPALWRANRFFLQMI
ncbi:MAG: hypothetical protein A3K45_03260 [Chloroflexi bacterium RIFOXYC12_FULL_59_14]|nr:MAG: hypothetical protein A3K45_03260 [Chloroflexi bacterium RIFOXYC12_FULL_59_14]